MNAAVTRWYYFVVGERGGVQVTGAPRLNRREAEDDLACFAKNLRSPMNYKLYEGRVAPELDEMLDEGMTHQE